MLKNINNNNNIKTKVYSFDEEKIMLSDAKFSPSYDLSKILTSNGHLYLQLKSIYEYYNYNTGMNHNIVNFEDEVETIDYSEIKKPNKFLNKKNDIIPTQSCLLKLKNGKIVVFIPYCELINL